MSHRKKILHLGKDSVLAALIPKARRIIKRWDALPRSANHFRALVIAIINQQLSGKAADTIQRRFEALFVKSAAKDRARGPAKDSAHRYAAREKFPTPAEVLKMPARKMRKAGLSKMKVSFIKDLARKILDGTVNFRKMPAWTDEEIIEHLTRVKGIGRWTAEMFLIFSLGRDDVFSYGDLGLRNAMRRLYKLRAHPTPRQAERISAAWKPYRSLASRYLWASLEIE